MKDKKEPTKKQVLTSKDGKMSIDLGKGIITTNTRIENDDELQRLTSNVSKKANELQEAIRQLNEFEIKISISCHTQ